MKRLSASVLLFSLFLSACGGSSSTKITTPTTPVINESQKISLDIREISGIPLAIKATLSFAGVEVLDNQDLAITTLDIAPGTSVADVKTSSLNDAKDLKIMVKADGFVDMGTTVQLDENQKDYKTTIYLVPEKTGKVKEGIFTQVKDDLTDIASDGTTIRAMTLTLEESPTTPKLTVTIPEDTKLMDDDGNGVMAKSAVMVRFDPSEENVLDAYPGGLNVQADVGGVMEQVDFKSAGFASIVLKDDAGKKVKKFDKDISVAMQFKIGTTDGDGKVVEIDDIVPIWSYNEDKGTWVYEKDGTVKDLNITDNLYDVVYATNHLTYFNLDWKTDVCDAHIKLEDNANIIQNNVLKVVLKLKDYNINKSFIYRGDGFIDLKNIPDSKDWEIQFLNPITNELIDTERNTYTIGICGDRTITVDLPSTGNLPVTETKIGVNLYCGINKVQSADVLVFDSQQFLLEYGLAINEPFDFRTGDDGVLKIYDLPRSYYDQILNVNVFATDIDQELVTLALNNTSGPFPIKIGRDEEVNNIKLNLPQSYCDAGGFAESKINATLTCPSGNIPNTELQTIPFKGLVNAQVSGSDSSATEVTGFFENGEAKLRLLQNTEYSLTVSSLDALIGQNITNNNSSVITAGDDKTFDFILSNEYCSGAVENVTYTYESEGGTVIETPFINSVGSLDAKDYILPAQSTQLNYRTFSKSAFAPDLPEFEDTESEIYTVNGNDIRLEEEYGRTDFTIESDRIRIIDYETDDNDELQQTRDGAIGRLYNVGDQVYKTEVSGESSNTFNGVTSTYTSNFNFSCSIADKLSSFSQNVFSYSGEIIKLKCDMVGSISVASTGGSSGPETNTTQINQTQYIYSKKGVGEIATIDENCVPSGSVFGNNTPGCTVNDYDNRFLVE